jgi:alginate O-acetyltransferase complex protein AlgI
MWGLAHGLFLVIERLGFGYWLSTKPRFAGQTYAMLVHTVTFVLFRSEDLGRASEYLRAMFGGGSDVPGMQPLALYFGADAALALVVAAALSQPLAPWLVRRMTALESSPQRGTMLSLAASTFRLLSLAVMLLLCAMALSSNTYKAFIYFRF